MQDSAAKQRRTVFAITLPPKIRFMLVETLDHLTPIRGVTVLQRVQF